MYTIRSSTPRYNSGHNQKVKGELVKCLGDQFTPKFSPRRIRSNVVCYSVLILCYSLVRLFGFYCVSVFPCVYVDV